MIRIMPALVAAIASWALYMYTLPDLKPQTAQVMAENRPVVTSEMVFPARIVYAACFGVYMNDSEAKIEAARYTGRGAAACVRYVDEGAALLGAAYTSEGDARSVCGYLNRDEGIPAEVAAYRANALRIRITASEDRIIALETARDTLDTVPESLDNLSRAIDAGSIGVETARSLTAVIRHDVSESLTGAESAAGESSDPMCRALISALRDVNDTIEPLTHSDNVAYISSHLKTASVSARLAMVDMMNELR